MGILKKTLTTIPQSPGVYIYKNKHHEVIYVGKAKNLKKRVTQYVITPERLPEKIQYLIDHIDSVEIRQTVSEFEAILLEAKLIRYYQPKYNSIAKDDKSPIYIKIERYTALPRIELARKPKIDTDPDNDYFGPFQSSFIASELLKTLRKSIPYCTQKIRNGRPCFYTHLHLCSPCPSVITHMKNEDEKRILTHQYKNNMRKIRHVLSGSTVSVLHSLRKEMTGYARMYRFEDADRTNKQIDALTRMYQTTYDPFIYEQILNVSEDTNNDEMKDLTSVLQKERIPVTHVGRIECYDISNINGKYATGSMVVLLDGIPEPSHYKRFKIKTVFKPNDPEMLSEILTRRLKHTEWQFPDLIVVDGGKTQLGAALKTSETHSIPCIGLTKRQEEIIINTHNTYKIIRISPVRPAIHIIQRVRDEAHRFAHKYHTLLRSKAFID